MSTADGSILVDDAPVLPDTGEAPSRESEGELPPPSRQPQDDADDGRNDRLLNEARSYGFSDEELESYDDVALGNMLAAIDRRAIALTSSQQQPQFPPAQQQFPPQFQQQQPPLPPWMRQNQQPTQPPLPPWMQQQQPQQPPPMLVPPAPLKINKEEWGDDLVSAVQGINDHYAQQLSQMASYLQTIQNQYDTQLSQMQSQQEAQYTAWFDGQITGLGDGFASLFGKGPGTSLQYGSIEMQNRLRLNDAVNKLSQAYPQLGEDELFARAVRMEFGHHQSKLQKQQLSEQLRNRSRRAIGQPGRQRSDASSHELNPETGTTQSLVDKVQRMIDSKLAKR